MGCVPVRKKLNKLGALVSNYVNKNIEANNCKELKEENSENKKIERTMLVQDCSGNPYEKYEVVGQLRKGTYDKLLKVKEKDSEIYRVMRIVKKRLIYKKPAEEIRIEKEIHNLRKLNHPNIIKVFEFYNTEKEFFIISELCQGGELLDRIVSLKKFTEKLAAGVMKQIISAVLFSHRNQIIHRDLKPDKILIEEDPAQNSDEEDELFTIKIIDFGTADIFKKDTGVSKGISKQVGTPYYVAPETLNNIYNEKSDMWSCGVIIFILLCGCPPFYGKNDQEIYAAIKSGKYEFNLKVWDSVSQEAKNLIKKLLVLDLNKRPTAEQCLKDPWFAFHDDSDQDYRQKISSNFNKIKSSNNNKNSPIDNINCPIKNTNYNSYYKNSNSNNENVNGIGNLNLNVSPSSSIKLKNKNNNNDDDVVNDSALLRKQQNNSHNDKNLNSNNNTNNNRAKVKTNCNINEVIKEEKRASVFMKELLLRDSLINLKNFRAERKLQLATLYFMVETLISNEDIKLIKQLFNLFDTDKDGRLTKQDFIQGVKRSKCLDISEAQIHKLMRLVDSDGNGYIEYQELVDATFNKKKVLTEYNLKKAFDAFDKDKSGKISSDELKTALGVCNQENIDVWERIMNEIDLDGDGEISRDEFKTMMYNLVSST